MKDSKQYDPRILENLDIIQGILGYQREIKDTDKALASPPIWARVPIVSQIYTSRLTRKRTAAQQGLDILLRAGEQELAP